MSSVWMTWRTCTTCRQSLVDAAQHESLCSAHDAQLPPPHQATEADSRQWVTLAFDLAFPSKSGLRPKFNLTLDLDFR